MDLLGRLGLRQRAMAAGGDLLVDEQDRSQRVQTREKAEAAAAAFFGHLVPRKGERQEAAAAATAGAPPASLLASPFSVSVEPSAEAMDPRRGEELDHLGEDLS